MFGHLPEILGLLVLGLIIFGPKRMIELGGQLGRALRELQSSMKEMDWSLMGDDSGNTTGKAPTPLGKLSQLAQDWSSARSEDAAPATTTSPQVVETTATTTTTTTTTAQPTSDTPTE